MKLLNKTSLTTRLTLFYLTSTLLILICTTSFQFLALTEDLMLEDNEFLSERIASIRSMITSHWDDMPELNDSLHQDHATQTIRYQVRLQDKQGRIVRESQGTSLIPPEKFPIPSASGYDVGMGTKLATGDGRHYLLNAAWAAGGGDDQFMLVQVALDITDDIDLIANYRMKMGGALLVGLSLATMFGITLTRKGLQPLTHVK